MLVANSFDLWQKDIFFSAAEEVQKSADIMESAYRTWLRERREGVAPQFLDELRGELQMALGTAKWQDVYNAYSTLQSSRKGPSRDPPYMNSDIQKRRAEGTTRRSEHKIVPALSIGVGEYRRALFAAFLASWSPPLL
nr:syntaxin/T-SNARE family protein [Ipomoea batatas]